MREEGGGGGQGGREEQGNLVRQKTETEKESSRSILR